MINKIKIMIDTMLENVKKLFDKVTNSENIDTMLENVKKLFDKVTNSENLVLNLLAHIAIIGITVFIGMYIIKKTLPTLIFMAMVYVFLSLIGYLFPKENVPQT